MKLFLEEFEKEINKLKERLFGNGLIANKVLGMCRQKNIFYSIDDIPENFYQLNNASYMFLPGCRISIKQFGFWTKESKFLNKSISNNNENKFIYVYNRIGHVTCDMANHIGLLSNGTIICCCLDYEGEMGLGNINETSINSLEFRHKLDKLRENVLTCEVCRRCKGSMYIFDTTPLYEEVYQKIGAYSWDWHEPEADLWGRYGRWSKALSTVYIYTRIQANRIVLNIHSIQ